MHHFRGLRNKKSKFELQQPDESPATPSAGTPGEFPQDDKQYEPLDIDPSRAMPVQQKVVSPGMIIKGITAAVEVAKDVSEIVDNVQDAKSGKPNAEGKKQDCKDKDDGNVVEDLGDVIENVQNIVQNSKNAKGEPDVPPAVAAHNAKMRVKASSTLPQTPPKDAPKGQENQKAEVPPALAKALKHLDIVAARSKPPAAQAGPKGVNRHMKAAKAGAGLAADPKKPAEEKEELPPNLAKALRSMQIAGSRTPEGRKLAEAAVGKDGGPNTEAPKGPQIKVRAATSLPGDKDDGDEEKPKDDDLPAELKASRRHMEIFAASHKSGGPAPVTKIAKDAVIVDEDAPDEPGDEEEAAEDAGDDEGSTESVSSTPSVREAATQTDAGVTDPEASTTPLGTPPTRATATKAGDKSASTDPTAPGARPLTATEPAPTEPSAAIAKPGPEANAAAKAPPVPPTKDQPAPTDKPEADKGPTNPTAADIIRYRYQHGVNLGSIYVLERWLTPSAFPPDAPEDQSSELDCVKEWIKEIGLEATAQKFEERWAKAMSEEDWDWLTRETKCNAIRLPVGHFTLGPEYCKGTAFQEVGDAYKGAWASVKKFVGTAHGKGIGVLIDLHALPGGANPGEHSGTNSQEAKLWDEPANLDLATECVEFIAKEVRDLPGAIGIQLCNEAEYDAKGMYEWYDKLIAAIAAVDPKIPLFISDAWDLAKAVKYVQEKNKLDKKQNPLVADTHVYFCFEDEDKALSPKELIDKIPSTLSALDEHQSGKIHETGAPAVIVGEYSCALDPDSWGKLDDDSHAAAKKELGTKQVDTFAAKTGGSFFWTQKMDWMDGGDWGFVEMTKSGAVKAPAYLGFSKEEVEGRTQNAESKAKGLKEAAIKTAAHGVPQALPGTKGDASGSSKPDPKLAPPPAQDAKTSPRLAPTKHGKSKPSHKAVVGSGPPSSDPFIRGWELGWNDARSFFRSRCEKDVPGDGGADRIGLRHLWVLKRLVESGLSGGELSKFEQGVWKGIGDFEDVALD